jgi:hypothetical protein
MNLAAAGEGGVKTDDASSAAFVQPRGQLVAAPDAQPAEIDDLELATAPFAQSGDALEGFDVAKGGPTKTPISKSGRSDCRQSWNRCTSASKRENGSALRFRDSEIRQYRQIWAQGACRSENRSPFPTISRGIPYALAETAGATSRMKQSIDWSNRSTSRLP